MLYKEKGLQQKLKESFFSEYTNPLLLINFPLIKVVEKY